MENRAQQLRPNCNLKFLRDPQIQKAGKRHLWVYEKGKNRVQLRQKR